MPAATEARRRPAPRARPKATPRERPAALLCRGNSKLGREFRTFSIPALSTCPGASDACKLACYALANRFHQPSVKARYRYNLERTKEPGFVDDMVEELQRSRAAVLRLHVSGDLYSYEYTMKWVEIARRVGSVRVFFYTRSWARPDILPALRELAAVPSVRAWYSCDASMGVPPRDPGVRIAFMLREGVDGDDSVPAEADLVFRTKDTPPRKFVANTQVCPYESGVLGKSGRIGCSRCRICVDDWRPKASSRGRNKEDGRP